MKPYRLLLTSVFLEGILAFIWLFAERSMQRNAVLLGYSATRIAMGVLTFILLALVAWWVILAYKEHPLLVKIDQRVVRFTEQPNTLLVIFTGLGLVLGFLLLLLLAVPNVGSITASFLSSEFDDLISTIIAVINRTTPLLVWAVLIIIQIVVFLLFKCRITWRQPGFFSLQPVYYLTLTAVMLPLTLFHWAILYYQLYIFVAIPHWFWKFYDKPSTHDWLFFPLALSVLLIAALILWFPEKTRRNLIMMLIMGYLLQVGFGFIEDTGYERLQRNFMEKGHHGYAQFAARGIGLVDLISNYETIAETDPFFMTKPPGVISFYIVANQASSVFINNPDQPPDLAAESRYMNLTHLMSVVFPFLAVLVLIPLYGLSKNLLNSTEANLPGLLFIAIPAFILTPLYLDQEIYPFLFTLGLLVGLRVMKTGSLWWVWSAGIVAYLAIFFSFSLLPIIPITLLWIGLDYLFNYKQRSLFQTVKIILVFFLGFIVLHLLFKLVLNYDFIVRYQNALAQHRLHKDYLSGTQQIIDAAILNNAEFFAWLGFPMAILFISALGRTLVSFFRRQVEQKNTLMIAFMATFIALNIMGQTRSEVARLWLFMTPVFAFFASSEARHLLSGLFSGKTRIALGFIYILALQLVTTFLTFKYQDLD